MATVYSTVGGKRRSATAKLVQTPSPGGVATKVIAEYLAAALQVADVINLLTVPAGSSYRMVALNNAALGAGSTLAVGRAGATAEQLAATSTAAAASTSPSAGFWRYCAADEDVIATLAGAAATGRIQIEVEIVRGNVATNQA